MPTEDIRYSPRYLGRRDTAKLRGKWDNDLIMDWIETQPNPLEAPEFYEPMAEHDPPQITLSREIRQHLGESWPLDGDDDEPVHPLAVEYFEHEEEMDAVEASATLVTRAPETAEGMGLISLSTRKMGTEDARLAEGVKRV